MKRVVKRSISVLLTVLMLCSMVTITLPTSAGATTSSKWYMGGGSTLISESSEVWVVDTVTVTYTGAGWIQHKEQMTELIGKDGKDGKGFINVIFGDGSVAQNRDYGYAHFQLVGKSDPTIEIPYRTVCDTALDWAFRGDGTESDSTALVNGRIANTQENNAKAYGSHAIMAAEGYRVVFTRDSNDYVMVRGVGNGVFSSAAQYTGNIKSSYKLTEIPGDNDETAADGVYYRLYSNSAKTITTTIAYPMPADYDVTKSSWSRWSLGGSSTIVDASTEHLVVDTATVEMPGTTGYFQHSEKLTDLIGKDGKDGKGFINVLFGDGTATYNQTAGYASVMLTGKADPTIAIPRDTINNQALNWALRGDGGNGYLANAAQSASTRYDTSSDFTAEGYRFAFTSKDDQAYIRGIGQYVASTGIDYSTTQAITTKLTDIEGDNGETAADGVYFRMHTRRGSDPSTVTVTVAYPVPAEGINLVPEDVFASYANTAQWFKGALNTDASYYSVEDGEYVAHFPRQDNWTYSTNIPTGAFTVEFDVCPVATDSGTLGSIGVLIGENSGGGFPWMNAQIQFKTTADGNDYSVDGVYAQHWYHTGSSGDSDVYGDDPLFIGTEYATTAKWYNVRVEIGQEQSRMYVDGVLLPEALLGYIPTADEVKYIGFWPAGSTNGFKIKNYTIVEGVSEAFVQEDLFENYDKARAWFTNAQKVNAYDQSNCYTVDDNGDYVMRVPVVSNGGAWIYDHRTIPYESYTVSVDFSPNEYTTGKIGGAGFQVGETVSSGYRFHQIRFNFDKTNGTISFRGHAQGSDPDHTYSGGIDYIDDPFVVVKSGIDFSTKQWFNLTAEVTGNSIQVFLDGEQLFVEKIDRLPAAEDIAYFGFMAEGSTAGFDVKNFSITEGVEGEIKNAAPELNEAITLHLQADVDADSAESVRMKFTFKGEDIWADGVLSGDQYTFALPNILPQDMCENICAQLYIDGMRKDKVATYSLQQYCTNVMPSVEDAAADTTGQKQKLRNVLIALLNYGTESQKYFEGITDTTLLANSQLEDSEKVSVNQAMTNAGTVRSVGTRSDENNYWKSASLALFNTVRLRFKFVTNDASKITIKVEGDDQTYTNFDLSTGNVYYWDYDQVYANQIDKEVKVGLYVDSVCVQTVTYSINSYVNAFVAANDTTNNSYALIQAVYDYGCAASAYNA